MLHSCAAVITINESSKRDIVAKGPALAAKTRRARKFSWSKTTEMHLKLHEKVVRRQTAIWSVTGSLMTEADKGINGAQVPCAVFGTQGRSPKGAGKR